MVRALKHFSLQTAASQKSGSDQNHDMGWELQPDVSLCQFPNLRACIKLQTIDYSVYIFIPYMFISIDQVSPTHNPHLNQVPTQLICTNKNIWELQAWKSHNHLE